MSGFSLHVNIYINPSDVDKFFELFKPIYEQVITEPECRFFEVYQSPDDPGAISWVENWAATPQWFMENQITKDYYKGYLAATEPMFVKPREFKLLNRLGTPYYMVKDH